MRNRPETIIHDRYVALDRAHVEKYRALLVKADPRFGDGQYAFHYCHNWGNNASREVLAKYHDRSNRLSKRASLEYWTEARKHDGTVPDYLCRKGAPVGTQECEGCSKDCAPDDIADYIVTYRDTGETGRARYCDICAEMANGGLGENVVAAMLAD